MLFSLFPLPTRARFDQTYDAHDPVIHRLFEGLKPIMRDLQIVVDAAGKKVKGDRAQTKFADSALSGALDAGFVERVLDGPT